MKINYLFFIVLALVLPISLGAMLDPKPIQQALKLFDSNKPTSTPSKPTPAYLQAFKDLLQPFKKQVNDYRQYLKGIDKESKEHSLVSNLFNEFTEMEDNIDFLKKYYENPVAQKPSSGSLKPSQTPSTRRDVNSSRLQRR